VQAQAGSRSPRSRGGQAQHRAQLWSRPWKAQGTRAVQAQCSTELMKLGYLQGSEVSRVRVAPRTLPAPAGGG